MLISLTPLITLFNSWPADIMAIFELLLCFIFMMSMLRLYGIVGLYAYVNIALIVANIQVLKGGQFIFPAHPIAMGTLLFGTIALAFDIITEYYSKAAALKGVRLGFISLSFFTLLMIITIGVQPLGPATLAPDILSFYENHLHIKALFMPMPGILAASLISYVTSQYLDVIIFRFIRQVTHQRWLWLRAMLATSFSALVDTCLFSLLAWKIFNPVPVTWTTLFLIYILGTYPLRLLCSLLLTPFIYLAKYCLPPQKI